MMHAIALAVIGLSVVSAYNPSPVVQIESGPVRGVGSQDLIFFKGIPYAADTGGANRYMPPQPAPAWKDVRNATTLGPGCLQVHHNPDVPKICSEDCLNLNIWMPANALDATTEPLPVMVFFHGGSFAEGSNQGPFDMYDGSYTASTKPLIIITSNYRLGALGFLAVGDSISGNQGILDQRFALQWVQRNIKSFGGDPSRVTLWGESAGAMSTGLHLVSPGSDGLYHQAIMESNPSAYRYRTLADMKLYGDAYMKDLGCNLTDSTYNITCAQAANASAVQSAWNKAGNAIIPIVVGNWDHWFGAFLDWLPNVDGTVIPMDPYAAWQSGKFNKVPLLLGTNENEGETFIYAAFDTPIPTVAFDIAMDVLFNSADNSKKIQEFYKDVWPKDLADGRTVFSKVLTDFWFQCASQQWATGITKADHKVFLYHFNHVFSDAVIFHSFGLPAVCENATCHATELPFVFHSSTNPKILAENITFTSAELTLEQRFVDYWASFGIHGDPNVGNSQPNWPVYDLFNRTALELKAPVPDVQTFHDLCTFWDGIGYNH